MAELNTLISVSTQAELKAVFPAPGMIAYLLSKSTIGDNLGGFYRWDENATGADDTLYMKSFCSSTKPTGRWVRTFQTIALLTHGTLFIEGGKKTFYASLDTVSGGTASLNLTMDNTATGDPIFREILSTRADCLSNAATVADLVLSGRKSLSADLKQVSYLFFKANPIASITVGNSYSPYVAIGPGIKVGFRIEGF